MIKSFSSKCKDCKTEINWDEKTKKLKVKRKISNEMCLGCMRKVDQFNGET